MCQLNGFRKTIFYFKITKNTVNSQFWCPKKSYVVHSPLSFSHWQIKTPCLPFKTMIYCCLLHQWWSPCSGCTLQCFGQSTCQLGEFPAVVALSSAQCVGHTPVPTSGEVTAVIALFSAWVTPKYLPVVKSIQSCHSSVCGSQSSTRQLGEVPAGVILSNVWVTHKYLPGVKSCSRCTLQCFGKNQVPASVKSLQSLHSSVCGSQSSTCQLGEVPAGVILSNVWVTHKYLPVVKSLKWLHSPVFRSHPSTCQGWSPPVVALSSVLVKIKYLPPWGIPCSGYTLQCVDHTQVLPVVKSL